MDCKLRLTCFRVAIKSEGLFSLLFLDLWDNPEEFNPNRFLDENGHYKSNDNLIPFSVGKRFCLGKILAEQEFFLFLTGILHQFKFESPVSKEALPNVRFCDDDINTAFIRYPPNFQVILRPRL